MRQCAYDVIVKPQADRAYTIFAEALDRSGYARATLTPNALRSAPVPEMRKLTLLTMQEHGDHNANSKPMLTSQHSDQQTSKDLSIDHSNMQDHQAHHHSGRSKPHLIKHSVLEYQDLRPTKPAIAWKPVDREITLRLTGNMNRYIWSFNSIKYSDAEPIRVQFGDHIRFKYINETMMNHPIHLHGLWQYLDIGQGHYNPKKHVVNVKPGQTVEVDVIADAVGEWAFHCHLLYHMESGMFRKLIVEQ